MLKLFISYSHLPSKGRITITLGMRFSFGLNLQSLVLYLLSPPFKCIKYFLRVFWWGSIQYPTHFLVVGTNHFIFLVQGSLKTHLNSVESAKQRINAIVKSLITLNQW